MFVDVDIGQVATMMFLNIYIGQVATCLDSMTIQLCEKEAELVGLRGRVGHLDLDPVGDDQYVMIRINLCDEILDHCWLVFMVISWFFMFLFDVLFNGFWA